MADIYLRSSDGSDASDGLTWANAMATLAAALTAAGAGGRVFVSDNHAETAGSSKTLASPGTAASPVQIICVVDTADPEPPTARATTATVTVTGNFVIVFTGFAYCYGVTFVAGSGSSSGVLLDFNSTSSWAWIFDTCSLQIASTHASPVLRVGVGATSADDALLRLINTTMKFGATGQGITVRCQFVWEVSSGLAGGGAIPSTLFKTGAGLAPYGSAEIIGVDLSALTGTLVGSGADFNRYVFRNCKLNGSATVAAGAFGGPGGTKVEVVNCDSADTNYRYHYQNYMGTITQETVIVRTGGASDGTTPNSRKMVSTANSEPWYPLVFGDIVRWNETTASAITVTVEVVTDNVTLTDAEAWLEVEYLGTSGFPLALEISDRVSDPIFGTPTNQASSSETWTTTGLGTPIKQAFSVTFTPQEKGYIRARVMLAKVSTTVYVDPKLAVA